MSSSLRLMSLRAQAKPLGRPQSTATRKTKVLMSVLLDTNLLVDGCTYTISPETSFDH